jgi:hypothetical protein
MKYSTRTPKFIIGLGGVPAIEVTAATQQRRRYKRTTEILSKTL